MATGLLSLAAALLFGCGGDLPLFSGGGEGDADERRIPVVYLTDGPPSMLPEEEAAALEWLESRPEFAATAVQLLDLADLRLPRNAVVWWHWSQDPALPAAAVSAPTLGAVRRHLENGGALLLTLLASPWVAPLGVETSPPDRVAVGGIGSLPFELGDPPILGVQSYRGHPLLRRFWGGTATMRPDPGRPLSAAVYGPDRWPGEGRVWAVLKGGPGIDPEIKVGVEYNPELASGGRIVTLGAGVHFAVPGDRDRRRLELLIADALSYLHGEEPPVPVGIDVPSTGAPRPGEPDGAVPEEGGTRTTGERRPAEDALPPILHRTTYWRPGGFRTLAFEPASTSGPTPATGRGVLDTVGAARSGLSLQRSPTRPDDPFDLSGPRVFCVGSQDGRVDELWSYPRRILRDLRFGIVADDDGSEEVRWLDETNAGTFVARPEGDTFRKRVAGVGVTLHLAVAHDTPALVGLVALESERPVTLVARWMADGRPAWPRQDDPLTLELGWDGGSRAVVWQDRAGGFTALAGFGLDVDRRVLGTIRRAEPGPGDGSPEGSTDASSPRQIGEPAVTLRLTVDPREHPVVPFVAVGGADGMAALWQSYARLVQDPASVWVGNATRIRDLLTRTLDVTTPDPTFDEALRWAKVGVEAFRATTPDLGTGTVDGFAADPDGDGTRSPRYSSADAVWAGRAADTYGSPDLAGESLRLLARYRGVDGGIFDEMTPSWSLRFDADDTAPLFLVGLENHLRATGDRELLRLLWPAARAALEHGFRNDRDGDGLIDGVGGLPVDDVGRTAEIRTSLDLAGLWGAALEAAARLATWAGDQELAIRSRDRAAAVRGLLNEEFWNADDRFYFRGVAEDGGFVSGRTVLPALPLSFGLLEPGRATPSLAAFASSEFSTDWGVRLRPAGSVTQGREFAEEESVRPVLTGWVSLSEYTYHRPLAGFAHLASVLRQVRHANLGYIGAALDARVYRSRSSPSHQAVAEAMAVVPAIEGLLGLRVDAMEETISLIPHLPGGWDRVVASPIVVGDDAFRARILRSEESTEFRLERISGSREVRIRLGVPVPREVPVSVDRDASSGVSIRDEEVIGSPFDHAAVATVVPTESPARVVFRHGAFPQVIPEPETPEPGRASVGLRPIHSNFRFGTLVVELEGLPGRSYEIAVATPWPVVAVDGVPTARVVSAGPGRASIRFTLPGTGERYHRAELVISFDRR